MKRHLNDRKSSLELYAWFSTVRAGVLATSVRFPHAKHAIMTLSKFLTLRSEFARVYRAVAQRTFMHYIHWRILVHTG